jgi:hypothetical protein
MGKILLVALLLSLVPVGANATECPPDTMPLTSSTFICVAKDKNGKCTLVEVRRTSRCVAQKKKA